MLPKVYVHQTAHYIDNFSHIAYISDHQQLMILKISPIELFINKNKWRTKRIRHSN